MYSVNRTIGVATTFRATALIRESSSDPTYDCDIKAAVISRGWEEHLTRAGKLFLDPITAEFDSTFLGISNPRMVFAREATATLAQTTEPPASEIITITEPDLTVSRLDVADTDDLATLEFRLDYVALPPVVGSTTTDYNRIYLIANSATVEYNAAPAISTNGVLEPGVLHENVGGADTFDETTDLYLLDGAGGALTVDGSANEVWFDRTNLITDPVWNTDVVLAAVDIRNTSADDIDNDILRGSATAECSITFRIVM